MRKALFSVKSVGELAKLRIRYSRSSGQHQGRLNRGTRPVIDLEFARHLSDVNQTSDADMQSLAPSDRSHEGVSFNGLGSRNRVPIPNCPLIRPNQQDGREDSRVPHPRRNAARYCAFRYTTFDGRRYSLDNPSYSPGSRGSSCRRLMLP